MMIRLRMIVSLVCAVWVMSSCSKEVPRLSDGRGGASRIMNVSPDLAAQHLVITGISGTWLPSDAEVLGAFPALKSFLGKVRDSAVGHERIVVDAVLGNIALYDRRYYGVVAGSNRFIRCVYALRTESEELERNSKLDINDGKGFEFSYNPDGGLIFDLFLTQSP